MRAAGRLAAEVLDAVALKIKEGVTTEELNQFCHEMMVERGAEPAMLDYQGFPKSICTSVNHVAAHGIPSQQVLVDGDVLKVDVSLKLDGVYGDNCRTYFVGTPSAQAQALTTAAYNALMAGINKVMPGRTLGDVGHAVELRVAEEGYQLIRDFGGHFIGYKLHMPPEVPSFGEPNEGLVLRPGMIFTIEPIVAENEEWTMQHNGEVHVAKGRLAAQFEHTVLVTERGCEILTSSPKNMYVPNAIRPYVLNHRHGNAL